jgi:WD40 repeat protein
LCDFAGILLFVVRYHTITSPHSLQCCAQQGAHPCFHVKQQLSACRPEYCTASADGSVRIWDVTSHQQLYEFGGSSASSKVTGAPTAAAYHPRAYQLAVGYSSGLLQLFDVATTTLLLVSLRQHCSCKS